MNEVAVAEKNTTDRTN